MSTIIIRNTQKYTRNKIFELIIWTGISINNNEISKYQSLIKSNGIEIAGIEYIKGKDGQHYTYDINTNTNYNSIAEKKSSLKGMQTIAKFLFDELNLRD